jgi:hypothetical protein
VPLGVDVEALLNQHVNNSGDRGDMKLQQRDDVLGLLDSKLDFHPASPKRNVVCCFACRGSGKTQLIKRFVVGHRMDAAKCGRVIVRCCEKAKGEWIELCLRGRPEEGLCELVRMHVEEVTKKAQDKRLYSTPGAAYAMWVTETAACYSIPQGATKMRPLIILDTCEVLAAEMHPTQTHTSSGKRYTLLEAFCFAVPAPESIFVIGCNAGITSTDLVLTAANLTPVPPLRPLTEEGHKLAVTESWKQGIDDVVREPLYHLAGGLPRLLRFAHHAEIGRVTLAQNSFTAFAQCFEKFQRCAADCYPLSKVSGRIAYSCLLASSTKLTVGLDDPVPLPREWRSVQSSDASDVWTFKKAVETSIGTWRQSTDDASTGHFVVPPIIFTDGAAKSAGISPMRIAPSQLHPFLDSEVVQEFGKHAPTIRGQLFELSFLYAVYARYLLARWRAANDDAWVALEEVFQGAFHPKQKGVVVRYEVNLSKGVQVEAAAAYRNAGKEHVTYPGKGKNTHHDAYLWCREKSNPSNAHPMALQLRHGGPKSVTDLEAQLMQARGSRHKLHFPLVSVCSTPCEPHRGHLQDILFIHADAMSSISWLWLVSPPNRGQ